MKKTITLLVVLVFVAAFSGCHRDRAKTNDTQQTQTIAPAAPVPAKADQSGTSDVMTQTVEVDDSRSEGEGGTAAPATTTTTPKKPPAKHKKK